MLGFTQALLQKGARSVLLSRWKVDDAATALLMARFYENLLAAQGHEAAGASGGADGSEGLAARLSRAEATKHLAALVEGVPRGERGSIKPALPTRKSEMPKDEDRPFACRTTGPLLSLSATRIEGIWPESCRGRTNDEEAARAGDWADSAEPGTLAGRAAEAGSAVVGGRTAGGGLAGGGGGSPSRRRPLRGGGPSAEAGGGLSEPSGRAPSTGRSETLNWAWTGGALDGRGAEGPGCGCPGAADTDRR